MKFFQYQFLFIPIAIFGNTFPELPNTESTTDADPPSAEESAKAFSLPEGKWVCRAFSIN
jgi:hypothetical protein